MRVRDVERDGRLARMFLRGVGFALGVFVAVNLVGECLRPRFSVLSDWLSFPRQGWLRAMVGVAAGVALLVNGLRRDRSARFRRVAAAVFGAVATLALVDTGAFYATLARGVIATPAVVPSSLLVALLFAALAEEARRSDRGVLASAPVPLRVHVAAACAVIAGIPLVRMTTFGPTRYDRKAACAIVLGARVWNDGRPSDSLADRVDEGVRLYREGLVDKLVMSGGVEPENGISEPEVMRSRAVAKGVPFDAVILDEGGTTTARTAENSAALMRREGLSNALVVTHYYHEPRVKMLLDRAGVRAFTVPATMHRRLVKEPYFLAREVAAYWHSFLVS
jgi:uncharacterized SAM-binding protein YcdF (DUF218 family)